MQIGMSRHSNHIHIDGLCNPSCISYNTSSSYSQLVTNFISTHGIVWGPSKVIMKELKDSYKIFHSLA
jgi:hypothetical protein